MILQRDVDDIAEAIEPRMLSDEDHNCIEMKEKMVEPNHRVVAERTAGPEMTTTQ